MNNKKIVFILAVGAVTALASCSKKGDTGPAGPAGPTYTGAISGHVTLYDQYGTKVLSGLNAVQLSLSGGATTNPDASGYYMYGGITTGVYNFSGQCSGYGATKINNFQFLADTLNRDIKLSAIPNFSPTAIATYPMAGANGDSLVLTFNADNRIRSCMIFVNSNATVNGLPANYLIAYTKSVPANATRVIFTVAKQDLTDAGIASGSTAFFAVYGSAVNDASAYEDLATGKGVYTALSAAPVTGSAIVP